jgi:hypothetical protein
MTISMYDASVPAFCQSLTNLRGLLHKADEHTQANAVDEKAIVEFRLFPDMLPFRWQVCLATDTARFAVAKLAGLEAQTEEHTQTTFATLAKRIERTLSFIRTATREQIDGTEAKILTRSGDWVEMSYIGQQYLLEYAIPNTNFHITTAYLILRHNGVRVGKRDYLGIVESPVPNKPEDETRAMRGTL